MNALSTADGDLLLELLGHLLDRIKRPRLRGALRVLLELNERKGKDIPVVVSRASSMKCRGERTYHLLSPLLHLLANSVIVGLNIVQLGGKVRNAALI